MDEFDSLLIKLQNLKEEISHIEVSDNSIVEDSTKSDIKYYDFDNSSTNDASTIVSISITENGDKQIKKKKASFTMS